MKKNRILTWLSTRLRGQHVPASGAPPPAFIRVAYHTPRQVVLLTARHEDAENVWPIDWHIPLSQEPQLYGISLTRGGFGTELVRNSGAFVVNFVPATWEEIIFFCGRTSGRTVDKFAKAGLNREEASTIAAPRLTDALGCLECRVVQTVEVGDHTLFVGEVQHAIQRQPEAMLYHLDGGLIKVKEQFGDDGYSG